ncbi:MAG: four-carbon acid sugar kinase family protein, partial [Acidithiobacillus sp.]
RTLADNVCVVVDAEEPEDLAMFARAVRTAADAGKRFLFRSAASLLTALADLPPQPVAAEAMGRYRRGDGPGVILVGSHVRKSSEQLEWLLREPDVVGIEIAVDRTQGGERADYLEACRGRIHAVVAQGMDPVIFTSREERRFADRHERLAFGAGVSAFLMELVQTLPENIGFLISKGGITSNDTLSCGLGLATARVVGQILPGCSVLLCPDDHPRYPRLPVVIFPGNVGDAQSLVQARRRLRGGSS